MNSKVKKSLALVVPFAISFVSVKLYKDWRGSDDKPQSILSSEQASQSSVFIRENRPVGQESVSTLTLDGSADLFMGDGSEAFRQKGVSRLQAKVTETVIDANATHTTSLVTLSDLSFNLQIDNNAVPQIQALIETELAKPALIKRDRSGLVTEIRTEAGMPGTARNIYANAIYALQYSLPEGEVKGSWTASEEDGTGTYRAQYTQVSDEAIQTQFRRERQFYEKLTTAIEDSHGPVAMTGTPKGEIMISFNKEKAVVESVKGHEELHFTDNNDQSYGHVTSTVDWRLDGQRSLDSAAVKGLMDRFASRLSTAKSVAELKATEEEEQLRSMYARRLAGRSLEEILSTYLNGKTMINEENKIEFLLDARAYVYMKPDELKALADRMSRMDPDSDAFRTLSAALMGIATPEAQEAFVDLTGRMKDNKLAMETLVPGLGFMADPIPLVEETLKDLRTSDNEDTRNMATYSLGTLGSKLQAVRDNPESAERAAQLTADLIEEAKSKPDHLRQQLGVLGNLAATEALPFIEQNLVNGDVRTRSEAAMALRDIRDPRAQSLLIGLVKNDKDLSVRISAAEALGYAAPNRDLFKTQAQLLSESPDHRVRIELLKNLDKASSFEGEALKRILEQSSTSDPEEKVRTYAQSMLAQFNAH